MSLKYEVTYYNKILNPHLIYKRHDEHHRIDGPAIIWRDGDMFWKQYGERHRIGGPSGFYKRSHTQLIYHIRGVLYTELEYNNESKIRSTINPITYHA